MVATGLESLVRSSFVQLKGKTIGVLCNQASIDGDLDHILDLLKPLHGSHLKIGAIFGPQHGLFGHTQDNMIEWEGGSRQGVPLYSLYGEHREPTDEMLAGLDLLVIDLQDVGARYYTFIWTLALCLKACERKGVPVLVLDRPNPIGGTIEGPLMESDFASFVGLCPLPARHGMTIGEIALHFQDRYFPKVVLEVEALTGWSRDMHFKDTGLPWAMPSPNMPSPATALVYPGCCLLEGTNLSEGRGTTRPFEIVGAPWLDSTYAQALNDLQLPAVNFRPIEFQPTFQKHAGQICGGCFIHVLDRSAFEPVLTGFALMREAKLLAPSQFGWKLPPYEYEFKKRPIDILAGNSWLASAVEESHPIENVRTRMHGELDGWLPRTRNN